MSFKKRFQQIEPSQPGQGKKPRWLSRFAFQRKIEIEGEDRETLPEPPAPPEPPKRSGISPSSPPSPTLPETKAPRIEAEHRIELETLVQKIEKSEEQNQPLPELKAFQRQRDLEAARTRAKEAQMRIIRSVIVIVILLGGFTLWVTRYLLRDVDYSELPTSRVVLAILLTILSVFFGRGRRRW